MSAAEGRIAEVLQCARATEQETLRRWFELLRIPSVSAQPEHAKDCQDAAEWVQAQLQELGFQADVLPTDGKPCVLAHHPGPGGDVPHLLYYGHYDVQPPEPLELWTSPPFEPTIVEGPRGKRVIARGAVDNKGQLVAWLGAFRAWHSVTHTMPLRITVLVEGEEEIGSPSLEKLLSAEHARLQADQAVISDTNMWDIATPAITTRLRGLAYVQVNLRAAARDLHSGLYGGSAQNALNILTRALGGLHDAQGRVQLPGFYDRVRPLPPAQLAEWESLGFVEQAFLAGIGQKEPAGEKGLPALVRLWARPTADINGIWGGYTGSGAKTVIAAEAHAKVSFRLVPDQDPGEVIASFQRFIAERIPPGVTASYESLTAAAAIVVPRESRFVAAAERALREEFGRPPVFIGSGGSVPVVESFKRVLGLETLLMGFGLEDDQVHSPNEKFELACFLHGMRSHIRLLGHLGQA